MPAGWMIVLASIALLPSGPSRVAFLLAGIGVQALGLTIAVRSLAASHGDER